MIADLHVAETINIVILPELENCTVNKSLKIFGIIVELSWWFVIQQQGLIVNLLCI